MFESLLAKLGAALTEAAIPYMVIGGQAVLLYGEPRLTQDIDITLGVSPQRLDDVLVVAKDLGLEPLVEPVPFVSETLVLPLQEPGGGIRVDVVFTYEGFERLAIARATPVGIRESEVRFATVEDLVVLKMIAARPRDLEDVSGILLRNPSADLEYVREWLVRFDAALDMDSVRAFERILEEASS